MNVWDLEVFDGKVFLAYGSTVAGKGSMPIWPFDHATNSWPAEPETILDLEAIESYRVLDGDLYVPAADPAGDIGDRSKFHRRDSDGTWTHFFSNSNFATAHIRDLTIHDGWLIGVGNSRRPHDLLRARSGSVALPLKAVRSIHGGAHELPLFRAAIALLPPSDGAGKVDAATSQRNRIANWFFSVFHLHDGLYASTRWLSWAPDDPEPAGLYRPNLLYPPLVPPFPAVVRWNSDIEQWVAPDPATLHRLVPATPERDTQLTLRPYKPVLFGELWFAPLRSYGLSGAAYHDAYNQSADFVVKPADGPGRRVTLPDADALGEAVLEHGNSLYVLANARQPDGGYRIVVYALDREAATARNLDDENGLVLSAWREVLSFRDQNLARSFARIDDTWYFGLGFATGEPPGRAGTLLQYSPPSD
ncbi:MAG: hypothetical protein GVY36_02650 [Verrucomicrobia bacterium]|nr:hypothetical protein [Verrucomicrobiota bacterium]